jgi:hypothetical protein
MTVSDQPYAAPPGSAVVSPEEMYRQIRETHDAVTRIELGLQGMPTAIADHEARLRVLDGIPREIVDHEARLRVLERWQWRAGGIAAALGALVGGAAGLLSGRVG